MAPTREERVKHDKGKCAEFAKCIVRRQYDRKADPCAIHKEFSNVRRLFKFCTIREVSAPPRTYASNDALHFRQGVKPPPCASRIKGGVQQAHFFTNAIMGGGC